MADITFTGNTTQPDMRFTNTGKALLSFAVAENHRKRDGNGWVDDGTTFWRVTVWERQAETLAEVLEKGTRVLVTGTIRSREWEKDGEKRTSYDVTARQVAIVPKQQQGTTAPAGGSVSDPWASTGQVAGGQSFNDAAPF